MIDLAKLHDALTSAGLPVTSVQQTNGTTITPIYSRTLTQAEQDQADAIQANASVRRRRMRAVNALITDCIAWIGTDNVRLRQAAAIGLAFTLRDFPNLMTALGLTNPVQGDEDAP